MAKVKHLLRHVMNPAHAGRFYQVNIGPMCKTTLPVQL
ncbi:MAG: hypothetical protein JWR72_273 [Flavisolibacter sp.]|nr:hypothetical protein [Flavisolibacter sp.]